MFKIDFKNGKPYLWSSGGELKKVEDYSPRFYVEGCLSKLQRLEKWLETKESVKSTSFESWRPTLSKSEQEVLRVDELSDESLKNTVRNICDKYGRSTYRFYNVGISPQFRFCLQREVCPVPEDLELLEEMEISLERHQMAKGKLQKTEVNGKEVLARSRDEAVLEIFEKIRRTDPDILIFNRGQVIELLNRKAKKINQNLSLGRREGMEKLAGENTVSSYGKTVHSGSRYNIPGRAVIDRSNSHLLEEATMKGLWDLVRRSYRPIQELAWGSIGRLLTSIEVKKAYLEENTLTPWKKWEAEEFKTARQLHKADRGGFIFNPDPAVHRNVYEADFASLFPNIMIKKNISPETVRCDCCNNNKTPELNYSICEKEGFIPKVLEPLVEDRQDLKDHVDRIENEEVRKSVQGSIDAIKWILVSCFGYMGHEHASYGKIECHQAIQAFDRKIMVETKEMFEESGYKVAHGIIDSIWVQKKNDAESFEEVCEKITDEIGILLEPEHEFEWVAFVPRSSSNANISTLNRYFGKKKDGSFKTAGIEVEQKSSSDYVKETQMKMIKALDRRIEPEDAINVLRRGIERLEKREVNPERLIKRRDVSKSIESYNQSNMSVSCMKRYRKKGIEIQPGQKVEFMVKDNSKKGIERVLLPFEDLSYSYDTEYYRKMLVRSAESVLSPLNWDREEIRKKAQNVRQKKFTIQ